jgi:hypothetical protein
VDTTGAAPLIAAAAVPEGASSAGTSPLGLGGLSIRELICELAATEALLRQPPAGRVRTLAERRQTLIVGELRRRAGRPERDPNTQTHLHAIADGGVTTTG